MPQAELTVSSSEAPGAFLDLAVGAKLNAGGASQTPGSRLEVGGQVVRVRGNLQVKAANTVKSGDVIGTLNAAHKPQTATKFRGPIPCWASATGVPVVAAIEVNEAGGLVWRGAELVAEAQVFLDGVTFNL